MSDIDTTPTAQLPPIITARAGLEALTVLTDPRFAVDPVGATPIHDQLVRDWIDRRASAAASTAACFARAARFADAPAEDPEDQTTTAAPRGPFAAKLTDVLRAIDVALAGTDTRPTTDEHHDETGPET